MVGEKLLKWLWKENLDLVYIYGRSWWNSFHACSQENTHALLRSAHAALRHIKTKQMLEDGMGQRECTRSLSQDFLRY